MNYIKIYNNIINNAKTRKYNDSVYYESHHILPKSLGGDNSEDNLVKLTLREHYIAHKLLIKIYPKSKEMIYAFWMMTTKCSKYNIVSNRSYEYAKKLYIEHKIGKKYNLIERKNVSDGTKKAMRTRKNIEKSISGSKGCKYYYNKNTLETFKWFPNQGELNIDSNIYSLGRPPLSNEQKKKLSDLSNLKKTYYYIKELDIKYTCYDDIIKDVPKSWIKGWSNNKSKHIRNAIIKANREFNLRTNYNYDGEIIKYYPNKSKNFKIISPSIYELFSDTLKKCNNMDISNELCELFENNIELIKLLNEKYFI